MMKRTGVILGCVAVTAIVATLVASAPTATPAARDRRPEDVHAHSLAFFDPRTFAMAVARVSRTPAKAVQGMRGVIVPHHWLAGDLIVEGLRGLAESGEVRRVLLIGPNHIGAGGAPFSTSRYSWRVPGGSVRPDAAGLRAILAHPETRALPNVMSNEHSVAGLVPALSHFFPRAAIVPMAVRARTDPIVLRRMAQTLGDLLQDPTTVLVASVDFSHYTAATEAVRRNRESIRAITEFDVGRVLRFGNEHTDSPATIALVLETMRIVGANRFELWQDANSTDFGGPSFAPNVTSYVLGAFH